MAFYRVSFVGSITRIEAEKAPEAIAQVRAFLDQLQERYDLALNFCQRST